MCMYVSRAVNISEGTGNTFVDPCTCSLEHIRHNTVEVFFLCAVNWKTAQFDINCGLNGTFPGLGMIGVM